MSGWTSQVFRAVFGLGVVLNGLSVFALGGLNSATGSAVGKVAVVLMVVGLMGEFVGVGRRRRRATGNARER